MKFDKERLSFVAAFSTCSFSEGLIFMCIVAFRFMLHSPPVVYYAAACCAHFDIESSTNLQLR